MKQRILIGTLFLLAYLIFLVARLPAELVVRFAPLPPMVSLEGVSGTLWQGQAARLRYASERFSNVQWDINGWSLLTLSPQVALRFGERGGLNGHGTLTWRGGVQAHDLVLSAPAAWVLERLPQRPPFPLDVAGRLQLNVTEFTQGQPWCDRLYGVLDWVGAEANTPAGQLDLADPSAKLRCQQGKLVAELHQSSEQVSVNGKLELQAHRQYLFQGFLKPGPELPEQMRQGLPFLGQPDSQGRYPLRQQGRL